MFTEACDRKNTWDKPFEIVIVGIVPLELYLCFTSKQLLLSYSFLKVPMGLQTSQDVMRVYVADSSPFKATGVPGKGLIAFN